MWEHMNECERITLNACPRRLEVGPHKFQDLVSMFSQGTHARPQGSCIEYQYMLMKM